MKTNLKMAVAVAVLTILAGAASATMAQMVGGYKAVETTDEYARAAAEWAVREKGEKTETAIELLSLIKAERQTVQGANYRLCMKINTEDQDEPVSFAQAVVYMDLKKNYKLTSWAANSPCAKPAAPVPTKPPVVGGYKPVDTTDERARAAAEWAVREKGEKTETGIELLTLVKVEQQVVQGMNYRLCMQVVAEGEEPIRVQAVVYMDLKRNYRLTSWAVSNCK